MQRLYERRQQAVGKCLYVYVGYFPRCLRVVIVLFIHVVVVAVVVETLM